VKPAALFLLRRSGAIVATLLAATLLLFILIDLAPGDPSVSRFGLPVSEEVRAATERELGLDDPLPARYVRFIGEAVQGDLGYAIVSGQPVRRLIADALPVTLQVTGLSLLVAVAFALALGLLSAVAQGRRPDHAVRIVATAMLALPNFWVALLAINLFAVRLGWLPAGGYVPLSDGVGPWLRALVLPAVTLALPIAGILARVIRTSVAEELGKDYVRTARGSGLPEPVVLRNVLRNALVSPLTVLGLYVGYLLAGAVLIETVFGLPGLGRLLVQAALRVDIVTVRAVALVSVLLFLVVNLVVDLTYRLVDPRIKVTS